MTTSARLSLVLQTFAVGIECRRRRRRQELKEARAKKKIIIIKRVKRKIL
jgi:hypothetical protein